MIEIEKPQIECNEAPGDVTYGKYVVEPLERGEHDPPQGVAQRRAISPLQGFHHVFAIGHITRRFNTFNLGLFDFKIGRASCRERV